MILRITKWFSPILWICLSLGCKPKSEGPDDWVLPSNVLYFQIKHNDTIINKAGLDSAFMFYYAPDGTKITGVPWRLMDRFGEDLMTKSIENGVRLGFYENGVLMFSNVKDYLKPEDPFYSGGRFYIQFEDGDVDTLDLAITEISAKDGKLQDCYCQHPFTKVEYNGKPAVGKHPTLKAISGKPIYILEKE